MRHTIVSDHRSVICLVIEPESVRAGALDALAERLSGPQHPVFAQRIRAAYRQLQQRTCRDDITRSEFDIMCFGEALPPRLLDRRVERSIAQIGRFSGEPVTAASCAEEAGLSASRFLHLFKQETGISFRAFRAWKRARHLLHFANQDLNLAIWRRNRLSRLHPFQPFDPPFLWPEAAGDLLRLTRPCDLPQRPNRIRR